MPTKDLSKICVKPEDAVKKVLAVMSKNKPGISLLPAGIILIIGKGNKLVGVATDGDIRRALSSGVSMDAPVSKIMNRNPFLVGDNKSNSEILSLVVEKIRKE